MRQLLACLNISVFDPVLGPALDKVCRIDEKQEKETGNPFHTPVALTGMLSAALLAFYGLSAFPLAAGAVLFTVCGLALRHATSDGLRYVLKTYFFSGFLLLMKALFVFSPAVMTGCLFVCFVRGLFRPTGRWQRVVLSVLFFGSVCYLSGNGVFWALGAFSVAGTALLVFPLKNVYGSQAGFVFTILSVAGLLAADLASATGAALPLYGEEWLVVSFTLDLLLLLSGLWRDMEANELFGAGVGIVVLLAVGLAFSAGIQGSFVLFVVAFFSNSVVLGKIAAFLFACFLMVFFLSLPVSLFSAAVACAFAGLIFEVFRYRLGRFSFRKK